MITPATLPHTWCAYTVSIEDQPGIFYAGACLLSELARLPDARSNDQWQRYVTRHTPLKLSVLHVGTQATTTDTQTAWAKSAWCNIHGNTVKPLNRFRCVETGIIYDSITDIAKHLSVSRQAVSNHVNGRSPSVKGASFERTA